MAFFFFWGFEGLFSPLTFLLLQKSDREENLLSIERDRRTQRKPIDLLVSGKPRTLPQRRSCQSW